MHHIADIVTEHQEKCKMRIRVTSFTKHADHNPFHLRVHGTRTANGSVGINTLEEHDRWGGGPCKCVAEWVHFQLACVDPELTQHTHDLDIMDGYKRSEALAVLAKNKVEEGNGYSATTQWMHKTFGETSKQVSKFDKTDAANATQSWRNGNKDLVLRDEVPEDSEEMITMRKCVDAILEANALSLREALREVLKGSHELTKSALEILEKHKKTPPEGTEPEEPWWLAEGVTILDLPHPGPTEKLKELAGVEGPPRTPYPPTQAAWQIYRPGQGQNVPAIATPHVFGPDGRPISGVTAPLQGRVNHGHTLPHTHQHQRQGHMPVNMPQARGVPLQPRHPAPAYSAPYHTGVNYAQAPVPPAPTPPAPPRTPQRGSVHPITVSMEVPSCENTACKQCKHMPRDLAGRIFVFQDRLQTPAHFSKLQSLLREPQQLLHDDYTRLLHKSQVPYDHPQPHPALRTGPAQRPGLHDAPPLQRAPASAPSITQVQHLPPPVRHHPPPQAATARPSKSAEPENSAAQSTDEVGDVVPTSSPANPSIYDQPLPVPIVVDGDDGDDDAVGSEGDRDENVGNNDSDGGIDGGGKGNETGPKGHSDSQDATATNDEIEDDDGDEQRPAKRRRQESVAEA